jgi:peroxiredoxin
MLVALAVGVGARLETGAPPGLPPKPFAHLLGRSAPSFEVEGLEGPSVSLQSANGAASWLLVFTDAACKVCDATYPSIEKATHQLPVVLIGSGDRQLLKTKLLQHQISATAGYDSLQTVKQQYRIPGFPSVLLIDQEGVVQKASVGTQSIEEVLAGWGSPKTGGA